MKNRLIHIITPVALFLMVGPRPAPGETGFGPDQSMDLAQAIRAAKASPTPDLSAVRPEIIAPDKQLFTAAASGFRITGTDLGATGWDFIPLIEAFQARIPSDVANDLSSAGRQELSRGISRTYETIVNAGAEQESEPVIVELTKILVATPFPVFQRAIPAYKWGLNIAHRLGGEIRVVKPGPDGRPIRQLERMVLSGISCAAVDFSLTNQDMTKAEIIRYGKDSAKVYWRVYRSDNGSTKVDIGSVEFRAFDKNSVLVTFHSAHKVRGQEFFPNAIKNALERTFLDHARKYQEIAEY